MRVIDGVTYMSAKEYAELKNITESRVSQMKKAGAIEFERLDDLGVELINYDKLMLPDVEKGLMQLKMSTSAPIHTYSYQQLGVYFGKLLSDFVAGRQEAEALAIENTAIIAKWQGLAEEQNATLEEMTAAIDRLTAEKEQLNTEFAEVFQDRVDVIKERDRLVDETVQQDKTIEGLVTEIAELKVQLTSQQQLDEIVERVVERLKVK